MSSQALHLRPQRVLAEVTFPSCEMLARPNTCPPTHRQARTTPSATSPYQADGYGPSVGVTQTLLHVGPERLAQPVVKQILP